MTARTITVGSTTEEDRATAVITMAFSGDPIVRWVFPQAHQYLGFWPRFVSAFGGRAFENGTAHYAERFSGVALWLPPGVGPDEVAMSGVLEEGVADSSLGEIFAFIEKMGPFHPARAALVLAADGCRPKQARAGLRIVPHAVRADNVRPAGCRGVSRSHKSAEQGPLRTVWIRGDWSDPGGEFATDVAHGA